MSRPYKKSEEWLRKNGKWIEGMMVPVKVRRGTGGRLLKKTIQVERLEDGTLTHRP